MATDRLQAIQSDYSRAVEARITDLMAKVHAARTLNSQIADADSQIEIGRGDVQALGQELGGTEAGSDDHAILSDQIEGLKLAIADTEKYRDELVDALAKLVGEIGG